MDDEQRPDLKVGGADEDSHVGQGFSPADRPEAAASADEDSHVGQGFSPADRGAASADEDPHVGQGFSPADRGAASADEVMTVGQMLDGTPEPPTNEQLVAVLEAIVFASPEPITLKAILKLLDADTRPQVQAALAELKRRYEDRGGGLQFVEVANGYQIVTRPELHDWVRRMFHERTTQKLSVQALETLAVIAYKQPITAAEITEIRGVNTSGVIGTLLERGLVKISGRKQVVGRPFLYSTTREFLDRFGLRDLNDLPKVEDMADALGFEVPAGIATEAPQSLPADEPATAEDVAVIEGGGDEEQEEGEAGDEGENER